MSKDKTKEVIDAIANLRDHGECECSLCQKDRATVAANPETAALITKLLK